MLRRIINVNNIRHFCSAKNPPKLIGTDAPKEHSCGIPPWDPAVVQQPPPVIPEFPSRLIRPPCMPGGKPGGYQTCLLDDKGLYCPPCRLYYKYPSFSENIDFMPLAYQPPCWWRHPPSCPLRNQEDEKAMKDITLGWECTIN